MLIIVEGPDRCSKDTTINGIRKLIKNPKIITIHSGPPPKNVNPVEWSKIYYKNLLEHTALCVQHGWTVILNRSHLGETVYGHIFREVETGYIWELENVLDPNNTALVLLTDEASNIHARDDGISTGSTLDHFIDVVKGFNRAFSRTNIQNKMKWHIGEQGWPEPIEILKRINY